MTRLFRNTARSRLPDTLNRTSAILDFHRKLPHYSPTPVVEVPGVARDLGVSQVLVKDESARFGLPSFKLLGASWATYRAIVRHVGEEPEWSTVADLSDRFAHLRPLRLAAATDGNHGRAVAHVARLLGFDSIVFVPDDTSRARVAAIESEGARCVVVEGDYDAAVVRSAAEASDRCLVIDDTSWPGYEDVPRWVVEGYTTIFRELDEQLARPSDFLFVPLGVGALGAAAVDSIKSKWNPSTFVVGVEPSSAACVFASLEAGRIVTVPGPYESILAGLNCGTPSPVAFPTLSAGIDAVVTVQNLSTERAMRALAADGITSGETGAGALAGLLELFESGRAKEIGLGAGSTVLCISTEGATDPESYERIVGHPPTPLRTREPES